MSRCRPTELLKQLQARAAIAAECHVARRFVPAYHSDAAIRLVACQRRGLEQPQAARLLKRRRPVS